MAGLTIKQEKFCQGLFSGLSQREAYKQAYNTKNWTDKSIDEKACSLAKDVKVMSRIGELTDELKERSIIKVEDVLKRWWDIATADPNEIIHIRRVCCRNCFGIEHKYQWRDKEEYDKAVEYALASTKEDQLPAIPSSEGGFGFDRLLRPHPKCPICNGEGSAETHIEDTRDLSPQAKLLYAGVKQTAAGVEIKLHDQGKALENVARHLGMFIDKSEISIKEMPEIIIKRAD